MIGTSSSTIYSNMNHFEDEDSTSEAGPLSREPPAPVTSQ